MVEISFIWKLVIFGVILVIGYFVLRYYEIDPFTAMWESIADLEWNLTALILTIVFSAIFWAILWKTPYWATTYGGSLLFITGLPAKLFMTIMLPVIGYPLAVRSLNK